MPTSRILRRVFFVWLRRAWALFCCLLLIFAAVFSSSRAETGCSSHHERTSAAIAVCSWHTVSCGFFPRPFFPHSGQEQVTHARQDQVSFQSDVPSALVLIEPDLSFLILEAAFDAPAREGHLQQRSHARVRRSIADEELDLARIEDVAGDDQMLCRTRQAVLVFRIEKHVLAFPDDRAFLAVLDAPTLPGLIVQRWSIHQVADRLGPRTTGRQARHASPATLPARVIGPRDHAGRLRPAGEITRDLADIMLSPRRQAAQEIGLAA